MSERNRVLTPVAVESDTNRNWFDGEQERHHINPTFTPDDLARLRLGFNCLRCWEPQESAFPVSCWFCGYSIGELQARDLAEEFEGEKHVGPSTSVEDELELMRDRRESRIWTPNVA